MMASIHAGSHLSRLPVLPDEGLRARVPSEPHLEAHPGLGHLDLHLKPVGGPPARNRGR